MTTQPEALRLAEQLENTESARLHLLPYAAAELRRINAEVEELREANDAFSKRQKWWNEKMFQCEEQADRDEALLRQALEVLETIADEVFSPYNDPIGEVILALRKRLEEK